jgi:hypothetical protein
VKQRSDDLDTKQVCTTNLRSPPDGRVDERFATNAIAGAALLRMIAIDLQSSRSVPPSKRFAAIPIGGYRSRSCPARSPRRHKSKTDRIARHRWSPALAEIVGDGRPWTVLMISLLSMPCR